MPNPAALTPSLYSLQYNDMTLKQTQALLKGGVLASFAPPPVRPALLVTDAISRSDDQDGEALDLSGQIRRTRIWEFGTNLHCSIIGTCLSTTDLRHVLAKAKVKDAETASDHDLHCLGVMLASRREQGARFLQKALDRCHRTAIFRCLKIKDAAGLLEFWDGALKQGDIPGTYWAVLTHPSATAELVKRVFADVHMLSHLVGAANRADIRRLRQLEADNAALAAKVERQQRQLHQGFVERDRTIRDLNELVAKQTAEHAEPPGIEWPGCDDRFETVVADLTKRLAHETARSERSEQDANELSVALKGSEEALRKSQMECDCRQQELDNIEQQLTALLKREDGPGGAIELSRLTVLYVGGRPNQIPLMKDIIERAGGRLLHHDGGMEHSSGLIPGLISRADRVVFPIDCVSHHAVAVIKRHCGLTGKPYEPLRTASLACLLSALANLSACRQTVAAE
jgi:hypothetical protein